MVVPLWEIGRLQQLLSCKEMEIIGMERRNGTGSCWKDRHFETNGDGRTPLMLNRAQEELAANFANTHESGKRFACFALILDGASLANC